MRRLFTFLLSAVIYLGVCAATPAKDFSVYVDDSGVLRRSDNGSEMAYYGSNYTAPFAHAYRALGRLGVDRKEAIRRDVYHLSRLGFNAFRLHLWDVELSDANGNLLENEHLDLLDYLIAELEKRGIDIMLTAQTNFGNGYPEKNIDTGAYTYDFDKCEIHENPKAQKIQENYLRQLASHVNPYTGLSYGKDRAIIAMEINNEPCHSGTAKQVTAYINRMVKALRKGGFDKPVLYNVSHNPDVTEGYYKADIQGTTYQWYPTGLVAGRERHGNFLLNVDEYPIPWEDTMPGYEDKARFIYEFDPGDVLVSNLYPAIVRTLRGKGFQWITQFAYDPTDMARFNTEYQTHFLNLAYTPSKAISMLIAAKAMQEVPRGADYGKYPENKHFEHTTLTSNSSFFNSPTALYNSVEDISRTAPMDIDSLRHIAGVGSNAVISYPGTGAYFLDKLDDKHWRLEVMPDVVLTEDPFEKPSLNREVAEISYVEHPMTISLPALGEYFTYNAINDGNHLSGKAIDFTFSAYPGVYLLSVDAPDSEKWNASSPFGADSKTRISKNMLLGEYVAPAASSPKIKVLNSSGSINADSININAVTTNVDSLLIYPSFVSFWRENNEIYPMSKTGIKANQWTASIPAANIKGDFKYRIAAYKDGKAITYPDGFEGTPLSWDFPDNKSFFTVQTDRADSFIPLIYVGQKGLVEAGSVPDGQGVWLRTTEPDIDNPSVYSIDFTPSQDDVRAIIRADFSQENPIDTLPTGKHLLLILKDWPVGIEFIEVGLTDENSGVTIARKLNVADLCARPDGMYEVSIPVSSLQPTDTWLLPAAYPWFTARSFTGSYNETDSVGNPLPHLFSSVLISLPALKKDVPIHFSLHSLRMQ